MNENLNRRKADFIQYLDTELAEKPRKCWQQNNREYTPTGEMQSGKQYCPHSPEETVVKYNFKRALISGALFLSVIPGFYLITGEWQRSKLSDDVWIMLLIVLALIFLPLLSANKKGALIIFNKQGFWTKKMPELVHWDKLAASYIRGIRSDNSPYHYLLIYYYDDRKDEFVKMEYCIDGLDLSKEDIALQLEYWKMIAGVNAVTVN